MPGTACRGWSSACRFSRTLSAVQASRVEMLPRRRDPSNPACVYSVAVDPFLCMRRKRLADRRSADAVPACIVPGKSGRCCAYVPAWTDGLRDIVFLQQDVCRRILLVLCAARRTSLGRLSHSAAIAGYPVRPCRPAGVAWPLRPKPIAGKRRKIFADQPRPLLGGWMILAACGCDSPYRSRQLSRVSPALELD